MTIIILVLGMLTAFGPLSIDMYLPSLPDIASSFNSTLSSVQLSLASFFAGLAIGQIFYGPLTDRFGRKKPLYVGLSLYVLSSFFCAEAQSVETLIFWRFIQALGACSGQVISRAVVRDKYHAQESARIFSLLMLIMGLAPILAPILGGHLSSLWGWRSIFWVLFGTGVISLILVYFFLPETHKENKKIHLSEIIPLYGKILKNPEFAGNTFAGGFVYAAMFAYITGSPFVFMSHFGLSTSHYSWVFGLNAFGLILMSQVNRYMLKTKKPMQILSKLYVIIAFLGVALSLAGLMNAQFWVIFLLNFLFISSLGMGFPNSTASALASQGTHAGSASALMGTLQFCLSAIISSLVSYFHNGTLVPMTLTIGICGICSLLIFKLAFKNLRL